MSYEQAMKHYHNHRKNRFVQQCSGYAGDGNAQPITYEQAIKVERESWNKMLKAAKNFPFPAHIRRYGYCWLINDKPDLFSIEVNSYEELLKIDRFCL